MRGSQKAAIETEISGALQVLSRAVVTRIDATPPLRPEQEFEHRLGHAEILEAGTGKVTMTLGESESAWRMVLTQSELRAIADGTTTVITLYECPDPMCGRRFPRTPAFCMSCDMQPLDDQQLVDKLAATFLGLNPRQLTPPPIQSEAHGHARGFLDILIQKGQVELVEGGDPEGLVLGVNRFLDLEQSAGDRAIAMIDWLLDQPVVDEVFASEDEISGLINAYW